ncbi:MAG: DoxX family protein [Blastocatellia bacterium]|nr:DoxX family protein [Blastocatellia bacterium]
MKIKSIFRALLAVAFILAGYNHFRNPNFYLQMMPPYLPYHLALVYISGVFEVLGGIGIMIPQVRKLSGYGIIALLIAVFPANVQMLINNINHEGYTTFTYLLIARLPIQIPLILWAYWCTKEEDQK